MTGDLFERARVEAPAKLQREKTAKKTTRKSAGISAAQAASKKAPQKPAPKPASKSTGKAPPPSKAGNKAAAKPARKAPIKAGVRAPRGEDYSAMDIEVLEGLEPVRRRPGMYIGGIDERALHHLAAEIMDNAMDEAVAGHASRIHIHLAEDQTVTITDNGRGIPVDPHPKFKDKSALDVILTTLHSGGKFGGDVYVTAGGLHGGG